MTDLTDKPLYEHDCDKCIYLGVYKDEVRGYVDLYWCGEDATFGPTVLARWSDEGNDYSSGLSNAAIPRLGEAKRRAEARGLDVRDKFANR